VEDGVISLCNSKACLSYFIVWLVVQGKLIIGARMVKWGYKGEVKCCFCHNQIESRNICSLSAVLVTGFGTFVC
jgi:hypothetical protein